MRLIYLLTLLAALGCMVLLDRRFRLYFWKDARRATIVLVSGLVFFLAWDLIAIHLGIFARGRTRISTGILLAPELPLEEPVFLAFLCYLIMVLVPGVERLVSRASQITRSRKRRSER